eukprot:976981-Rhodomonas_salina.2
MTRSYEKERAAVCALQAAVAMRLRSTAWQARVKSGPASYLSIAMFVFATPCSALTYFRTDLLRRRAVW